jgi:hypothetical protein
MMKLIEVTMEYIGYTTLTFRLKSSWKSTNLKGQFMTWHGTQLGTFQ